MNRTEAFNVFAKCTILIWGLSGLTAFVLNLIGADLSFLFVGPAEWITLVLLTPSVILCIPLLIFGFGHPVLDIGFLLSSIILTGLGIYGLLYKEKLPSPEECDRELDEVERLKRERGKQP
jgi:hypothetical protein